MDQILVPAGCFLCAAGLPELDQNATKIRQMIHVEAVTSANVKPLWDWGGTEEVLCPNQQVHMHHMSTNVNAEQCREIENHSSENKLMTIVGIFDFWQSFPCLTPLTWSSCYLSPIWDTLQRPSLHVTPRHSTWQPEAVPWKRGFNWNFQCTQWEKWIFLEKLLYQTLSHKTSMKTWWVVRVVIFNIFNYGWKSDV